MKGSPVHLRGHEGSKGHCALWKEAREDTALCRMLYCLMVQVITSCRDREMSSTLLQRDQVTVLNTSHSAEPQHLEWEERELSLPSGVSVARSIIAFYSRFADICIYIYIYICLSARALHKTVHTLRKSYHIGHCAFAKLAAVRSTTLRSRPSARYGWRRQFSWRQPERRQRLKPYAYNYRT